MKKAVFSQTRLSLEMCSLTPLREPGRGTKALAVTACPFERPTAIPFVILIVVVVTPGAVTLAGSSDFASRMAIEVRDLRPQTIY